MDGAGVSHRDMAAEWMGERPCLRQGPGATAHPVLQTAGGTWRRTFPATGALTAGWLIGHQEIQQEAGPSWPLHKLTGGDGSHLKREQWLAGTWGKGAGGDASDGGGQVRRVRVRQGC